MNMKKYYDAAPDANFGGDEERTAVIDSHVSLLEIR